jgi:ribonuclease HII
MKTSNDLLKFERSLWEQGIGLVAGVDEVGRGPLAGPVVAAAVVFSPKFLIPGVFDSKKIPKEKRELFFKEILNQALGVGIGISDERDIDKYNILNASLMAMHQAVKNLKLLPEFVLVDGNQKIPQLPFPQLPIIKGDSLSFSIASASIVAKVTRDRIMDEFHKKFPHFCFDQHKGYSTQVHLDALKTHGPCEIHRKTFKRVRELLSQQKEIL